VCGVEYEREEYSGDELEMHGQYGLYSVGTVQVRVQGSQFRATPEKP